MGRYIMRIIVLFTCATYVRTMYNTCIRPLSKNGNVQIWQFFLFENFTAATSTSILVFTAIKFRKQSNQYMRRLSQYSSMSGRLLIRIQRFNTKVYRLIYLAILKHGRYCRFHSTSARNKCHLSCIMYIIFLLVYGLSMPQSSSV